MAWRQWIPWAMAGAGLGGGLFGIAIGMLSGPADRRDATAGPTQIATASPDNGQEYLHFKPVPKDYLLNRGPLEQVEYHAAHRILMEQMAKFDDWDLLLVRGAFPTYARGGRAIVIGLVFKTRNDGRDWIVWDQTWFFQGDKLIADFDTSEFGKQGAFAWCLQQEEIRKLYGDRPAATE